MRKVLLATLIVSLLSPPPARGVAAAQSSSDEAAVRAVVRQLFDAYARADLEGFMAAWSPNSPDYDGRKEAMSQVFAGTRDIKLVSLNVGEVTLEGERARTRVAAELSGVDKQTGQQSASLGKLRRSIQLVKEDGRWKVWRYVPVEQELADALTSAGGAEERRRLLKADADSVTPKLVQMLLTAGDAQANGGDPDGGLKVIAVAFEVADALDSPQARAWCYWYRGGVYENAARREEAAKDYEQAVAFARRANDTALTADILNSVAALRNKMGSPKEGIAPAEEALGLARAAANVGLEMGALNTLGLLRDSTGDYAGALAVYESALKLARETGRRAAESAVLNNMGVVYRKLARHEDALRVYGESLKIEQEANNEVGVAQAQLNIASVKDSLGRYKEALAIYEDLPKFFRERGLKQEESMTLNNIGSIRLKTGDYDGALKAFEESRRIKKETGDKAGESVALNNIANFYLLTARYAQAAELYAQSMSLKREIGDKSGVAAVLNNLASVYKSAGNYAAALDALRESLRVSREIGDRADEARALNNLGLVHTSSGEFAQALLDFDEGLKIARETGDRDAEADLLQDIGIVYDTTGRYEDALLYYERASALEDQLGNKAGAAAVLHNRATVYASMGRHKEALAEDEKSLAIARQIGDRLLEAQTLHNLATTDIRASRLADALARLEESLKIVRDAGDRDTEAVVLNTLGELYLLTGKNDDALRALGDSLAITEKSGDLDTAIHSYQELGDLRRSGGDWARAAEAYRNAVSRVEMVRAGAREHTLQIGLFGQYAASYFGLADSLVRARDEAGAFDASERAKARALIDLIQGGGPGAVKAVTEAERLEEQRLSDNVNALTLQLDAVRGLRGAEPSAVARLNGLLTAARAEYDEFSRRLFLAHPELQARRAQFEPASLAQLGRALFTDEPDLCLLSYFVGSDGTLLFVVTRGQTQDSPARLASYRLPVKRDEVVGLLRRFRAKLGADAGERGARPARPAAAGDYTEEARALYDALLAPAEKEIGDRSHLVIIPDMALSSLPFHALMDARKEYVVKRRAVSYAPSATALLKMRERAERLRGGAGGMLAVGRPRYGVKDLPDLPATEGEVREIARMFGSTPLVGEEASESRVKSEASRARYLHLATHGLLNEAAPMYSAIALARGGGDDGALYARELMGMSLNAELAVLSACDTALGQQASGEGVLGLTWSLFVAGVPGSVVSQWAVADDSTSELMVEFYRQLKNSAPGRGVSRAEALRRAQLKLLNDGKHARPYYWAPFVLIGEWRN
jgi:tetratricopeptide (TPR) repeat protein